MPTLQMQVLKRRMSERKDDTERCVLLLRKLGEPDRTLLDRYLMRPAPAYCAMMKHAWFEGHSWQYSWQISCL